MHFSCTLQYKVTGKLQKVQNFEFSSFLSEKMCMFYIPNWIIFHKFKKRAKSHRSVPRSALQITTPYNVGSVLWRLFSTLEVVQYIRGITSVLWGDSFSTVGDSFSTVEVVQYSGGITSVHAGGNISTVGDNISTVEGIQYCGGIPSVLWGDNSSTRGGIPSVLWRLFSTVGG